MRTGRPTLYSQAIADDICERLAQGNSLVAICKELSLRYATVMGWLDAHPEFANSYARAREAQADFLFDELKEIADTPVEGVKRIEKANGDIELVHGDMIEHRKLQIDVRKFAAVKLRPAKYGDRQTIEHTGSISIINAPLEDLLTELQTLMATGHIPKQEVALVSEPEEADAPGSHLV